MADQFAPADNYTLHGQHSNGSTNLDHGSTTYNNGSAKLDALKQSGQENLDYLKQSGQENLDYLKQSGQANLNALKNSKVCALLQLVRASPLPWNQR